MTMWKGQGSDYIYFMPMSLTRVNDAMKNGITNELDLIRNKEIWPEFSDKDIKVWANEERIDILSITKVPDFLAEVDGEKLFRPSYIVSIPKGFERKTIKVQIKDTIYRNNEKIIERGEGFYFLDS
ncbi:hypothetical protein GOQ27_08450 [Clostridium sp. D2Q-11]|uniref:Uncharacterized protein n=1 Tax=Anaeromonas frigoriresistens TaxID=2683708 RepID=A0A942Z7B0_9FIRM|nr:hypothetical protein [Anaeromonas frigoriresistens]MBS4538492.1 hypothetical protein [Anaeromonas frigoriresistens]